MIDKSLNKPIYSEKEKGKISDFWQLVGELLWYGKVLYTNGKVWKFLEISKDTKKKIREKLLEECIILNGDWMEILQSYDFNCLCVEIGNLSEAYKNLVTTKGVKEEDKLGLLEKRFYLRDNKILEWENYWARLKYNLAHIDWTGSNSYSKFLLKENGNEKATDSTT